MLNMDIFTAGKESNQYIFADKSHVRVGSFPFKRDVGIQFCHNRRILLQSSSLLLLSFLFFLLELRFSLSLSLSIIAILHSLFYSPIFADSFSFQMCATFPTKNTHTLFLSGVTKGFGTDGGIQHIGERLLQW